MSLEVLFRGKKSSRFGGKDPSSRVKAAAMAGRTCANSSRNPIVTGMEKRGKRQAKIIHAYVSRLLL